MDIKLAVIHGDGIGVEIIDAALRVLNAVAKKGNIIFNTNMFARAGAPSTNTERLCRTRN